MIYRFDEPRWATVLLAFRRDLLRLGLPVRALMPWQLARR